MELHSSLTVKICKNYQHTNTAKLILIHHVTTISLVIVTDAAAMCYSGSAETLLVYHTHVA
jgi:hypothetical protein